MKKTLILGIILSLAMIGCKPCSDLETKICTDLGAKCEK
ncbi:putative lipoprotein [Leptospira noguchii str. Bonito]|nr:putative lipoprotein [Leptospira noguchii str. Bonito]